jgi:hypothetical protein
MLLATATGFAAEVEWLKVTRSDGSILVRSEMLVEAPPPYVYDALLEYDQFAELSDSFTESRYIEPATDGTPRIYTRIEGCIWFFCKKIDRYARLELEPKRKITSTAEPELSDADFSIEIWEVAEAGEDTRITYSHELKPGFWVPPLLGTLMIKRAVKKSALDAAQRMEELALASLAAETQAPMKTLEPLGSMEPVE